MLHHLLLIQEKFWKERLGGKKGWVVDKIPRFLPQDSVPAAPAAVPAAPAASM